MSSEKQIERKKKICIVANKKNVIGNIASLYANILRDEGIDYIFVDTKRYLKLQLLFELIKERHNYDFIHVHSSGMIDDIQLIWTYIVSKLFNKKVIITYHCGSPELVLKKTACIINIFFNAANAITVPSNYSRDILLQFNKSISEKIYVLPNIVDISKWNYLYSNKESIKILTVSTINKWYITRKGLILFIMTAKELPEYDFYIIGSYDTSINLLKEIAPSNLHFTGYVSDDDLLNMYNSSTIYCQFSTSESFGYALAEAMSCGCVPVVTKNASLMEVAGNIGFHINNPNPKEAAAQIRAAVISNLSVESRNWIEKSFSTEIVKPKLLEIILKYY